MITRFYVDNYKCLQNFEFRPDQLELIVGANGTGKSTVFEALDKVRRFVSGQEEASKLFSIFDGTRWGIRPQLAFEVDYRAAGVEYRYRLEIDLFAVHHVERETLTRDGQPVFVSEWETEPSGLVMAPMDELSDSNSNFKLRLGQVRSVKWSGASGRTTVMSNPDQSALAYPALPSLTEGLSDIAYVKLNPVAMTPQVGKVEPRPTADLSNFASYYLYMLQQRQGRIFEMVPHLREAITDFDSFAIEEDFEAGRRNLHVVFGPAAENGARRQIRYMFDQLSDGQRALVALYTLLFCALDADSTLVIDEPENFVASRELQPWLMLLRERLEDHGGQVILISHHPEFINALAPSHTLVFERESGGPVRVKPFDAELSRTLAPSEIVARGWESE